MPALKYDYEVEEQESKQRKKHYKTVPIKDKSDESRQRVKKSPKERVMILNFALLCIGGFFAITFVAIYSIVAVSETRLANLHSQISELNYENIELENKLENVKSYYSVDTKVSSNAAFEKAKNVLEVDQVDARIIEHNEPINSNLNTVTGF